MTTHENITRVLRRSNAFWQRGSDDTVAFTCCCEGKYFAVFVCTPAPTIRQLKTIQDIQLAKGKAFVIDGDDALLGLEMWLNEVQGNASLP